MEIKILDHGYLKQIETWGSDERIVEAARMSTGKGFLGWGPKLRYTCIEHGEIPEDQTYEAEGGGYGHYAKDHKAGCFKKVTAEPAPGDEKLLKYLWEHKHATPFEMAGLIVEVQAPIFVFREWHRHRTQSYNEMSARYMPLPDVNYVPTVERLMLGGGHLTKQAGTIKGAEVLTEAHAQVFRSSLEKLYREAEAFYQEALINGVPKELARIHLPVGRYSRMRASANLRNWLAFLTLRLDKAAQYEIRMYANAVADLIQEAFPRTYNLFAASRG